MKITIEELEKSAQSRPQRAGQVQRAKEALAQHPEAVIIQTSDEKTGHRFGRAKCRKGRCVKIGGVTFSYPHISEPSFEGGIL